MTNNIVNLSDIALSNNQIQVLSIGFRFLYNKHWAPHRDESQGYMDRLHHRLHQIVFFEGIDSARSLNTTTAMCTPILSNLDSLLPYKHRNVKLPSTGKGPHAQQTIESMVKNNKNDFIN